MQTSKFECEIDEINSDGCDNETEREADDRGSVFEREGSELASDVKGDLVIGGTEVDEDEVPHEEDFEFAEEEFEFAFLELREDAFEDVEGDGDSDGCDDS